MILSTFKGEHFKDGKMQSYQTWKLVFVDWHREYPIDTAKYEIELNQLPNSYGFRSGVMFDPSELEDLGVPEEKIEDLMAHFPEKLREESGGSYVVVYVDGNRDQLEKLFELYAATFFDSELGGDDQTFDYWPNSLDMILRPLADDLDEICGTIIHKEALKGMYLEFIKKYGPVPEYTWDPMGKQMPEEEEE